MSDVRTMTAGAAIKRERSIAQHIPFTRHATPEIVKTEGGQFACVIKLEGYCFQTADQADINARFFNRNSLFRALGSSRYIVYSYIIRRRVDVRIETAFGDEFSRVLDERYMSALETRHTYTNELYLVVMQRPMQGSVGIVDKLRGGLGSLFSGDRRKESEDEARKQLLDLVNNMVKEMEPYGARLLGLREEAAEDGSTRVFSEPCEFLFKILNGGQPRKMRLPRMAIADYVGTSRIHFGRKSVHIDAPTSGAARFGAMLGIKEYPSMTAPGLLNGLLQVNAELIVAQSFSVIDRPIALGRMDTVKRQIALSSEAGTVVEDSIDMSRDQLVSGEASFGQHHFTVLALSDTFDGVDTAVAEVGAKLTDLDIVWVREDLNCEPSFWAQIPGNYDYIARSALVSSRNFAGFTSLHNFAVGRREGNHWGPATSVLQTTSQTPYFFSFHERDLGNFTVIGPSGSGKTVALSFLCSQARRTAHPPKTFFFDKDRGAEIFIRAIGGRYETLRPGVGSGFNPFRLVDTPRNRAFVQELFAFVLRPRDGTRLSASDATILRGAIDHVFAMERDARTLPTFAMLLMGQSVESEDSLAKRLGPWLREHGWLFNNQEDALDLGNGVFGFDMTDILGDEETRTAALMYVFHRIEDQLDGQPVMIFLDEGWRLLSDPVFERFIKDKLKTIRKLNGIIGFGTQSASDIVQSGTAATLIEQSACNIFFPNPKADEDSYRRAFQLSGRELAWIRESVPESREFLVKRGRDSVIATLDLGGMNDLIKVLSGRAETIAECERLRHRVGDDPAVWLPIFCGWTTEIETLREAA